MQWSWLWLAATINTTLKGDKALMQLLRTLPCPLPLCTYLRKLFKPDFQPLLLCGAMECGTIQEFQRDSLQPGLQGNQTSSRILTRINKKATSESHIILQPQNRMLTAYLFHLICSITFRRFICQSQRRWGTQWGKNNIGCFVLLAQFFEHINCKGSVR